MNDFQTKKISELTVKIDRSTCIATTNCSRVAPEVFQLDEENIISFKNDNNDIEKERLIEACSVCPVNALSVLDKEGNELVP